MTIDNIPKTIPIAEHEAVIKEHEAVIEEQVGKIARREHAIAVLVAVCVLVTLYILSASGCFLGRWPIIITGGGHGGGDGSTVEGGK